MNENENCLISRLLLVVLGNLLNAHAQRGLAVLIDDELTVGGQFQDLLVLHSVHVVVHEH